MSTSPGELDRFLAELRGRRQRLLRLVDAEDTERAALVTQVRELGEQLIVAEEELQIGQQELERGRQRLAAVTAYSTALFQASAAAVVLTDQRGVVLLVTRAAQELVRQAEFRRAPRPVTTWFDPTDRPRIRTLITHQDRSAQQVLHRVLLRRGDGSSQRVDVTIAALPGPTGDPVLRWELTAADPVPGPVVAGPSRHAQDLAVELAAVADRLAGLTTVEATLEAMVAEAVRLVPAAEHALVVELPRRGRPRVLAASDLGATAVVGHRLAVPLGLPGYGTTELRVSADGALGAGAADVAELLAVHFRIAATWARKRQNLEYALETRQLIGQAVGVLVERRRWTADAAFEQLVQRSQLSNLKLREVARIVVETGQDLDQISDA